MVDRHQDALVPKKLNTCTLEDLGLTYQKLKHIGHEEVQRRLNAFQELQKSVEIEKFKMTREVKSLNAENTNKWFGCKREPGRQELLTLPKIYPDVYPFDSYKSNRTIFGSVQREKSQETDIKIENPRPKKRAKKAKSKPSGLCVNCQLEAMRETSWLPQLDDSKLVERRSKKDSKEEKFVLPDIRINKNQ